jgi:hypothetical protein
VQSKLARFTDRCIALSQKAVGTDPAPPVRKGEGGYADWVIIALHGLREYLDLAYRRLLDVLSEMPGIKGFDETVTMNISGTYEEADVSFTMTKAFHSSGAPLETDYDYPMGTPAGYVIDDGETAFYHAGDTGLFGDMKTVICDVYAPDVAAVPIGDRHTMDPELAGTAVDWVGADAAIPMHYNTFPVIEQDPQDFVDAVTDAEVFIPDVGDSVEY